MKSVYDCPFETFTIGLQITFTIGFPLKQVDSIQVDHLCLVDTEDKVQAFFYKSKCTKEYLLYTLVPGRQHPGYDF